MSKRPYKTKRLTAPHPESLAAKALVLNAQGWPNVAIAAHLGCSLPNVSYALKRYGRQAVRKRRIAPEA